ncbi:MAG: DUF4294 domain-containing protein [Bacteroidales bacterium]
MKTVFVVIALCLGLVVQSHSQQKTVYEPPEVNLDSLFVHSEQHVMMGPEVLVFPEMNKKSRSGQRKFDRLTRYFLKVYPYAKLINETIDDIESDLDKFQDDRLKKQYIRYREKQLREKYGKDIRKLTISQGLLLIKLIDRETGDTSYEILQEFKGGFLAGMYQGVARLFGHDLKKGYDPKGEDKEIEILVKLYENGQLSKR